jgi:sugar phosphate isomerase/epimerase
LLFGQPDLLVFGVDEGAACLSYLANVCAIARWTGANALVFGSPKNRRRGALSIDEAFARGRDFFRRLGEIAAGNGVTICLEANPPRYGCDFLETVDAAAEMVAAVDSSGLKLNLDMGEMIMNGADVAHAVESYAPLAAHFHVSEPQLDPFNAERPEHALAAAALRRVNYRGLVSLEMKTPAGGLAVVNDSLHAMLRVYFGGA